MCNFGIELNQLVGYAHQLASTTTYAVAVSAFITCITKRLINVTPVLLTTLYGICLIAVRR